MVNFRGFTLERRGSCAGRGRRRPKAIVALARKSRPRYIRADRWYYRAIATVFATVTALAAMRWAQD
jgi:hypothetical protein